MAGKHRRVVPVTGDETYERIWDLVRLGAVVSVEFVLSDERQMLATTTIVDDHGVTVDQPVVEVCPRGRSAHPTGARRRPRQPSPSAGPAAAGGSSRDLFSRSPRRRPHAISLTRDRPRHWNAGYLS